MLTKTLKKKLAEKHERALKRELKAGQITKITPEEYHTLAAMFESTDTTNHTMALSVIQALNVQVNLPYILILMKDFNHIKTEDWNKICPEVITKLRKLAPDEISGISTKDTVEKFISKISFASIYRVTKAYYRAELDGIVSSILTKFIIDHMASWKLSFFNDLDIRITLKENVK